MGMDPRLLRPKATGFDPKSISGLALWLDGADAQSLYTTDAGPVTAVAAPTEISGCVGWWDASDAATITQSGGLVSQWNDKSGQGNNATASGSLRPTLTATALNGRSVMTFAGTQGITGNFASAITSDQYSVFVVCRISGSTTNGRVFSTAGAGNDFGAGGVIPCCTNASSFDQLSAFNGTSGANVGSVGGFSSWSAFSGVSTTSSATNAANGLKATAAGVTLTTDATRFGIGIAAQGSTGQFLGSIAEVVFYSTALSDSDRARVEAYLAVKWGISGVHKASADETAAIAAPTDLTGCALWLDASDSVTQSGGVASQWSDKSGNARHFTASGAAQPAYTGTLNGRPVLTFNGSTHYFLGNSAAQSVIRNLAGYTVIAVCKPASVAAGERFAFGAGSTVIFRLGQTDSRLSAGGRRLGTDTLESITSASGALAVGTTHIHSATVSHSTQSLSGRLSGVEYATDTTYMASGLSDNFDLVVSVGSQNGTYGLYNGDIAELIIYNTALSATDRARVEKYLAQKWGIANVPDPTPPVGYWRDKSGGGRHARQSGSSTRPVLRTADTNGKSSLLFTQTSGQALQPTPGNPLASASAGTMVCVCRSPSNSTANGGPVARFGVSGTNDHYGYGGINAIYYGFGSTTRRGPLQAALTTLTQTHILSVISSPGQWELWQNSARALSDSVNTVAWETSAYAIGGAFNAALGSGAYFSGNICEVLLYSKALSNAERRRLEVYLAAKWGITALAPTASNADAQDWINRVYINGGTVSSTTASAVNTFCDSINAAGIRDRFYRLNLFCGTGLAACLVPLYRGQSVGGTQYGNTTDTNNGPFVSGDYVETGSAAGGLTGNGSTKFLNTGLPANTAALGDRHLAVYERVKSSGTYRVSIGARIPTTALFYWELETLSPASTYAAYGGNTVAQAASPNYTGGAMWLSSQPSTSSLALYKNGSLASSSSTVNATNTYAGNVYVFALNENGTTGYHSDGRFGGYSIGLAMTDAQAAAYYTAMQTFQTALSRNV